MIFTHHHHQPRLLPIAFNGGEITVTPVPLRRNDPSSPWCYAANIIPIVIDDDDDDDDNGDGDGDGDDSCGGGGGRPTPSSSSSSSSSNASILPRGSNFLATQVWPSSRIASNVIERNMDTSWTVCELGCGPGLPSLTAAKCGARRVIATDVDEVALNMVRAAAIDQGFIIDDDCDRNEVGSGNAPIAGGDDEKRRGRDDGFVTMKFDLTSRDHPLPMADLYVLSDVFESSSVAEGAAWHVRNVLSNNRGVIPGVDSMASSSGNSRVWVFAQSDRAQRDSFFDKMKEWYENEGEDRDQRRIVGWTMDHNPNQDDELWLFDLDETTVDYN